MKKTLIHTGIVLVLIMLTAGALQNPFTLSYVEAIRETQVEIVSTKDNPMVQQITEKAKEYHISPMDARVDKVWKAVPGYNGVEVDVQKSYDKMEKLGEFDEKKLVFKEVEPHVHLEDLPPSPIFRGNEQKQMVTLLVNVAWGNEYIPELLKTMNRQQVQSTFFLDGSWVHNNATVAQMIYEEGHEIGSHAYSHPDMQKISRAEIIDQMKRTNDVIDATLGVTPRWFAPPGGSFTDVVVEEAAKLDMNTILWSVDTIDWRKPQPQEMVDRVLGKLHPGATILMHPTDASAKGLEKLIMGIKEQGYEIGTLSELMAETRTNFPQSSDKSRGSDFDTKN
ncbi:polysaccharide deacetylase family protein [Alkalicoccobacillus murimartini]|uniref:Sporulation protein (Polysaccharide deacetylase family) n=1 Tax=Alkalicoccobacillus murimartini TaxID=171685 RepID=A0ABT9YEN7_9BACI|nr:polysaccharide deacetylase family protein [Alkalicoccobacillus murimartini]MDQ0206297.1 putative sporulation protein (polysaccharide deacetylase family) [Alkalicoccobacillus murimartini]